MGLSAALAHAANSLSVFTTGIQVTGQNIANASTPGYIREKAILSPASPARQGDFIYGTGVEVVGIQQQVDLFVEQRIHTSNAEFKAAEARNNIYKQLEFQIGELSQSDLSTGLNRLLGAVNDVVAEPASTALRQFVVSEGEQFAADITDLRRRIDTLRSDHSLTVNSLTVEGRVKEANQLLDTIETLNPKIVSLERAGFSDSDAGALRTERYNALDRLSEIVPIRFQELKNGFVEVRTGSEALIQVGISTRLEAFTEFDRNIGILNVRIESTKSLLPKTGGELNGIAEGRDIVLGGFIDSLDEYASAIIYEFNKIHSAGEGTKRFTSLTSDSVVADSSAALNDSASGLPFVPEHGRFEVKIANAATGITETTTIKVDLDGIGADSTAASLVADLDAVSGLNASITADGRLHLDADPGFEFSFANDSSHALAALGLNTFFTGYDSNTIGVNSLVASDDSYLATSQGGGPSDNQNAIELAQFAERANETLNGQSIVDFYGVMIANVAHESATEQAVTDGLESFKLSLFSQKQQISGVSLDQEAVQLIEFQNGYQAAARMISTLDELFTVLLNL